MLALAFLFACAGPSTVDPSTAKASDLVGWWVSRGLPGEVTRVFGFEPPPDGYYSIPVDVSHAAKHLSAAYAGDTALTRAQPLQYAAYDVSGGQLLQTVIDDAMLDPGTQLSTRIHALTRGAELTLESSTSASGRRTYTYAPECPVLSSNGSTLLPGTNCLDEGHVFATQAAFAFDSKNRLHSYVAQSGDGKSNLCNAFPTYLVMGNGCEPSTFRAPNALAASLIVDDADVVHLVYAARSFKSTDTTTPEATLMHRFKSVDASDFSVEQIAAPENTRFVEVLHHAGRLVVVAHRKEFELFEKSTQGWTRRAFGFAQLPVTTPATILDAAIDRDGTVVLATSQGLYRETSGDFEPMPKPTPTARPLGTGLFIDASGAVHQQWNVVGEALPFQYGILRGGAWSLIPLQLAGAPALHVVPTEGPPYAVLATNFEPFAVTQYVELSADGRTTITSFRSENILPSHGPRPAAARARDGSTAVSASGGYIQAWRSHAPWGLRRAPTTLTITIGGNGTGRVFSDDGRVDCRASCTVELGAPSAIVLHTAPDSPCCSLEKASHVARLPDTFWVDLPEGGQPTFSADFLRSVVARPPLALGTSTASLSISTLSIRDGALAFTASGSGLSPLAVGAATVTPQGTASADVLVLQAASGTTAAKFLPATPSALALTASGSLEATFVLAKAVSFEGTSATGSTSTRTVYRVAWDAGLTQTAVEKLADLPTGTTVAAVSVDASGAVTAVVTNPSGFTALGTNVFTALLLRSAPGQVRWVPFLADELVQNVRLAVDGAAVAVLAGSALYLYDAGQRTGAVSATNATFGLAQWEAGKLFTVVETVSTQIAVGTAMAETLGSKVFSTEVSPTGAVGALVPANYGKVVALGGQGATRTVVDQTTGGPYFSRWGTTTTSDVQPVGTPAKAVQVLRSADDGGLVWVLVQQSAEVTYGSTAVPGVGRKVLLALRAP
ncbi:MAG: hypothetical protein K1X89_23960 [Myxococcaceae bacterium]|nr:hypothetical protein [Myxococcaceae bacterium]